MSSSKVLGSRREGSLAEQLWLECDAMAAYAFTSGMSVPMSVVQILESVTFQPEPSCEAASPEGTAPKASRRGTAIHDRRLPDRIDQKIRQLAWAHDKLKRLIVPANPGTILLMNLQGRKKTTLNFLGPIPLVRRLWILAFASLFSFIALSMLSQTYGTVIVGASSLAGLLTLPSLLASAALGASFTGLYRANRYVVRGTYDVKYDGLYWIRVVTGLIAGIILANLVSDDFFASENLRKISKPTLALLGGFSSEVVYRILTRLVDTIESFIRGDAKEMAQLEKTAKKAQFNENVIRARFQLTSQLVQLQKAFDGGQDPQSIRRKLEWVINHMMQTDYDEHEKRIARERVIKPTADDITADAGGIA